MKEAMGWEAKAQYKGKPLVGDLRVHIDMYVPDRKRRDLDNIKGVLDALTGILWEDDSQIVDCRTIKVLSPDDPRFEIGVELFDCNRI